MNHADQQQAEQNLGQNLRQLRKERGWSLDRAASETGVSKAMLGQIERGESSPTLATLWKLAGGFQRSMSSLIEPATGQAGKVRSASQLRQQPTQDQMLVAPLFPFDPQFGFELFELTLLPGYQRESEPHEPGVTEHVMVIEGSLEVLLEERWRPLQQGEAIRFAADRPHGYRNLNDKPAVFHNLIHYPVRN